MFVRQQQQFKKRLLGSARLVDTLWGRKLRTQDIPLQFASYLNQHMNGNSI